MKRNNTRRKTSVEDNRSKAATAEIFQARRTVLKLAFAIRNLDILDKLMLLLEPRERSDGSGLRCADRQR